MLCACLLGVWVSCLEGIPLPFKSFKSQSTYEKPPFKTHSMFSEDNSCLSCRWEAKKDMKKTDWYVFIGGGRESDHNHNKTVLLLLCCSQWNQGTKQVIVRTCKLDGRDCVQGIKLPNGGLLIFGRKIPDVRTLIYLSPGPLQRNDYLFVVDKNNYIKYPSAS